MTDYAQDTVTQVIDGLSYTSDKLPAMKAYGLLARCLQAGGPSGMKAVVQRFAVGFAESVPTLVEPAISMDPYIALIQLGGGLERDPELPRDLLSMVQVDKLRPASLASGKLVGDAFDTHFGGELPHLWRVCEFVAVHNFLGFTLGPRFPLGSRAPSETETEKSPA